MSNPASSASQSNDLTPLVEKAIFRLTLENEQLRETNRVLGARLRELESLAPDVQSEPMSQGRH